MSDLLSNVKLIHTTPLGEERIRKNIGIDGDAVKWCINAITNADLKMCTGKNWYVYYKGVAMTVNAANYCIITAHKISGKIRLMQKSDYVCLAEFLFQAIFVSIGDTPPQRDIIKKPQLSAYIDNFGGTKGDYGVVAEQNGQVVGAAWTRVINGYGHIDGNTPELAISVLPEFRGCGIGTKLMKALFKLLRANGQQRLSLSVHKANAAALNLYNKLGFTSVNEINKTEYLMLKVLR